jgi:hypothetical protein
MGEAETKNAILARLTRVGPAKPVAYLPLHTIRNILHIDPQVLVQDAEVNGLGVGRSTSSTGNHLKAYYGCRGPF